MDFKRITPFIFSCFFLLSIRLFSQTVDSLAVDGQVFVKIKDDDDHRFPYYDGTNDNVLTSDILSLKKRFGISKIYLPFGNSPYKYCKNTYLFKFTNIKSVLPFIAALDSIIYVQYAEKAPLFKITSTPPNDPYFNNGVIDPTNWHLKKINAESAWNISIGSSAITVAVIDNEIDQSHPDLSGVLWTNPGEIAGNGIDDDGNGYIDDVHGWDMSDGDPNTIGPAAISHGSHCAGLVGAQTNNNVGVSSIGNGIRIMPLKVTPDNTASPSSIDLVAAGNAINYAVSNSAKVISMSFGSGTNTLTFQNIVASAISSNVTLVAAAGNNNSNALFYPAAYAGVISVGATDYNDHRATFSNYGTWVDVFAPGTNIWSTFNTNVVTASHLGYAFDSGTSMATPITAGLCGLLLSVNPALTTAQVKACLKNNADNIDAINQFTYAGQLGTGRINAVKTLLCASSQNAFALADINAACTGQQIHLTGSSNASSITGWAWAFSSPPTYVSGTSTSQNPVVSFSSAGAVTVTLSVSSGSTTYTYTQTNFITINTISATLVSTAAGALCNGSDQQLVINFQNGTPPFNYAISNGLQTFNNSTADYYDVYSFQADPNHTTYSINSVTDSYGCQSNPASSLTFTIVNCCSNLIANGDFEQGNTNVNSDNIISCSGSGSNQPFGYAGVFDMSPLLPNNIPTCHDYSGITGMASQLPDYYVHNNIFTIDGRAGVSEGNNTTNGLPFSTPTYTPGYTSRLWYQNNVVLTAGDKYNVDFFYAGGGYQLPIKIKFEIRNASTNAILFSSPDYINPSPGYAPYISNPLFQQYSFIFDNSATGTNYSGNVNVNILQEDCFGAVGFDQGLDDISIRKFNTAGAGAAFAGPDLALCGSGSVQLSGSGGPSYSWAPSAGLSNTTIAQPTANPTVTTTYTLTTTNAGCGSTTDEVLITVENPTLSVTANPSFVCPGQQVYLQMNSNATNGVPIWEPYLVNQSQAYSYALDYPITTTTYTASMQISGTCSVSAVTTVTVINTPILTPVSNFTICNGVGANIGPGTVAGSTYTWTPNPSNLSCFTCSNPYATPTVTTIYTVAVTNTACPTSTATASMQVYVRPLVPAPTLSVSPNPICAGNSATISIISPNPTLTYYWYTAALGYINGGPTVWTTPTLTTTTLYNVVANSYSVNCWSTYSPITVTVNPAPTLTLSGTNVICSGSSTLLTATGANTYTWSPGAVLSNSIFVSPTTNTTYSAVGTNTLTGCSGSASLLVNVSPLPTITIGGTTSVCSGSPTILSASGAGSYTWSPGPVVSNTISVAPTVATTYTFAGTATGGSGCIGTKTITVSINPSPTIIVKPTTETICIGGTALFQASGVNTYTWSTGSNNPVLSTSPVTNTIYTVVGTNTLTGCTGSQTATVTVNPLPTITASSPTTSICYSNHTILNAGGGSTYTWTPGSGLSCSVCTSTTATPSVTTTYTVTGTSSFGCVNTSSVTINLQPNLCTGTQPTYTINSSGIFYPVTGFINQNLYINSPASYVINCADVRMAPGVSIIVANGSTLTINASWLHACASCSGSMWSGITVQNGGTLNIINNSIIEDAVNAVYTANNTAVTPLPTWSISSTIFNKNTTDIYIDTHPGNLSANTVYNTIFTSRNLSNHSTTPANFTAIKNDITSDITPAYVTGNPTSPTLAGSRGKYGIYVNQLANTASPILIGSTATPTLNVNVFDNLSYGMLVYGTSMNVKNNQFQNMTGNNSGSLPVGVGIYASGPSNANSFTLNIGNAGTSANNNESNYFVNCLRGILASNWTNNLHINNNRFSNAVTATTFSTPATFVTGECAVYNLQFAGGTSNDNLQFVNNVVQNYATGYYLDFGSFSNTSPTAYFIATNTITATGTSNQYCNTGIYLQEVTGYGAAPGASITGFEIVGNTITNVNTNCIYAQDVNVGNTTNGFLDIQQNTELSVKANTYTVVQSPRIAAVSLSNCWYTRVSDNTNIHCTGYTGTSIPTGQFMAGIYSNQSPRTVANCNTISNIGECFVWESTSPSYTVENTSFQRNHLDYSRYGLVLRNTGVMGDQGSSSYPINDAWGISSHFAGAQTLSDNSNPAITPTSKLYESASSCTLTPCVNAGTHPYVTGTTLLSAGGINTLLCASDANGGGTQSSRTIEQQDENKTKLAAFLLDMLKADRPLPAYDYETHWALHNQIHSIMPDLSISDKGYENALLFADVDAKMAVQDYIGAQTLLNRIKPNNILEVNNLNVDNILIRLKNNLELSTADADVLQEVAKQCHLTGGSVVWKARALLNNYYKAVLTFADVCPAANNDVSDNAGVESLSNSQAVNIYPNPNEGKMIMEYNLTSDAQLRITDITGKLIGTYKLNAAENSIDINMESLINGMYMFTVTNQQGLVKTGRIAIIK